MKQFFSRLFSTPISFVLASVFLLSLPWYGAGGVFAFVGWVPILFLHRRLSALRRRGFLWWVALTIVLWHCATCWWVAYATWLAIPVIPIGTLLMLIPAWILFHFVAKRSKLALAYTILVCAWVVCEWWLAQGDVSFSWLALGGAFAGDPALIQWYSITGLYGGTVWVMVANILIFTALTKRKVGVYAWCAGWVVVPMVVSAVMYWSYEQSSETVEVAIIQPNIDAYEKFSSISAEDQTENLLELAGLAPLSTALYIAPETALVAPMDERVMASSGHIVWIQEFLRGRKSGGTFVVGASTYDDRDYYNSALFIDTLGVRSYHKGKLVLGVETIPGWVKWISEAVDLGGYVGSLGRQDDRSVFEVGGVRCGAAICYESIHGDYFADWARSGSQVMMVITNDGWWGDTPGYRQHFSYSRIRAIESRRAIARSANTGISGVISSRGDVLDRLDWDVRGTIIAAVPLSFVVTPYMVWGDIVVRLCGFVLGLGLLFVVARHYRLRGQGLTVGS